MDYQEFLKGTGAENNDETYAAYKKYESIYLDDPTMSKQETYALYWQSVPEMSYVEFLARVRRPDYGATRNAYKAVNMLYQADEGMTKERALSLAKEKSLDGIMKMLWDKCYRHIPELSYDEFLFFTGYRDCDNIKALYDAVNILYESDEGMSKAQALAMAKRAHMDTILDKAWPEEQARAYMAYQAQVAEELDCRMSDEYLRREHALVRFFYDAMLNMKGRRFRLGFNDFCGHYMDLDEFTTKAEIKRKDYDIFEVTAYTDYPGRDETLMEWGNGDTHYSIHDLMDYVCSFGGYVYIMNENDTIREIEFEGPAPAKDPEPEMAAG